MPHAETPAEVVARLQSACHRTMREILAPYDSYALLDFPNHSNVGDSAIWLGERTYLRAHRGLECVYVCDVAMYRPDILRARLYGKNAVILIHGGGNFGDLYERHQRLREAVVRDFQDWPIVQLPQTINFQSARALDKSAKVINLHPRLMVLTRDRRSNAVARSAFGASVQLCPDMAFMISDLRAPRGGQNTTWLLRTDHEAAQSGAGSVARSTDWLESAPPMKFTSRWAARKIAKAAARSGVSFTLRTAFDVIAKAEVRRGIAILGQGRAVVTDRLHGHILCTLLGLPHVVLDDGYGKISSYMDTWGTGHRLVRVATSPSEANELVTELATPDTSVPRAFDV